MAWRPVTRNLALGLHLARLTVLEARPAQLLLLGAEDRLLNGLIETVSPALANGVQLIEALDKEQIGKLLDHFQRIGDPARPERIPDLINLIANVTS